MDLGTLLVIAILAIVIIVALVALSSSNSTTKTRIKIVTSDSNGNEDEENEDMGANEVRDRFNTLSDSVGVDYRSKNVFGNVIVLNDKSYAEDGTFGRSYFFSNGDRYECGVFGYKKTVGGIVTPARMDTDGDIVFQNIRTSGKGNTITGISMVNGSTFINGKDYTGLIPQGASISVENGAVYVNGKLIEAS